MNELKILKGKRSNLPSTLNENYIYIALPTATSGTESYCEIIAGAKSFPSKDYVDKKFEEADTKYVKLSNGGSSISISQNGSFNNYGNNGQAFNAVRDVSSTNKYSTATGSGYPLNAASFGVKDNGTTAFSHKKYDTFNTSTGAASGAKNTAVLVFSGKSGLLYAKNTGSANDVTDAMYKRVGVIDSPDEAQCVYSTSQIDGQINTLETALDTIVQNFNDQINELKARVVDLENQNTDLYTKVELLMSKANLSEEELNGLVASKEQEARGGMMSQIDMIDTIQKETDDMLHELPNNIKQAIVDATFDYSTLSDEPGTDGE